MIDWDVIMTPGYAILVGVGYIAFVIMIFMLKAMGNSDFMPLWVKIVTVFAIPAIAYIFTYMHSS